MGVGVVVAAVAIGASVVEVHFTLAQDDGGVDWAFSLEPEQLTVLVQESNRAWEALGQARYGPTEAEKNSLVFRRLSTWQKTLTSANYSLLRILKFKTLQRRASSHVAKN